MVGTSSVVRTLAESAVDVSVAFLVAFVFGEFLVAEVVEPFLCGIVREVELVAEDAAGYVTMFSQIGVQKVDYLLAVVCSRTSHFACTVGISDDGAFLQFLDKRLVG